MLKITKDLDLRNFSGLGIGDGTAMLYEIDEYSDFEQLSTRLTVEELENIITIGEGSNTVFVNKYDNLNLLRLNIKSIESINNQSHLNTHEVNSNPNTIKVGAGVNWDFFVQRYIEMGGVGMESLSAIPGTVGAAPIQNIGAYGHEVSEFISGVYTYDTQNKIFRLFSKDECEFTYRNSIFKKPGKSGKNRYIILYVIFEIKRGLVELPQYQDIEKYFLDKNITEITVENIRQAVIEIRKFKLPDPKIIPNCGSFFKNPVIDKATLEKVQAVFPEIPVFQVEGMGTKITEINGVVKIPIAYIIEQIGLKGYNSEFTKGNFGTYKNHALILISNGKGSVEEFLEFTEFIKDKVLDTSGLRLEEEVNLV